MELSRQYSRHSKYDSSKLRRTQSMAVHMMDEESSVSSLGSFPEADIVAQQFSPAKLSRQQTIAADRPAFRKSHHRDHRSKHHREQPAGCQPSHQKKCPHCLKSFRNSWAVPKHVSRIHDRAGEFHCPRCLYKTHSPEWLQQHEKEAHRTCPYCQQLFVLLNKHVGTCPKRMH